MSNLINKSIGRYHILEQLGQGGMATVYKAFDTRLEREVAIKIIRKEAFPPEQLERVLQRFEREAKALAKMSHANIVKVHDFGDYDGAPYLVMELLSGGTLKQYTGTAMPYQEAARILEPIARALAYAHELGVLHRDVKPANILITQMGEPILTDFGIAKLLENDEGQTLTGTGIGVGTPEYMAPEQGLGKEVDGRADIYALGVVFFELVTGRKPFTADTPLAVLLKQVNDPLPRPIDLTRNLPDEGEKVLFKALAKDPEDRYQKMDEFGKVLQKLAEQAFPKSELRNQNISEIHKKTSIQQKIPIDDEKTRDDYVTAVKNINVGKKSKFRGRVKWVGIGVIIIAIFVGLIFTLQSMGVIIPKHSVEENNLKNSQGSEDAQATSSANVIGSTLIREKDGMVQVYVPAGEFKMGSDNGDFTERPIHTVYLDAFWIDQTEVTNAMYSQCVIDGVCTQPEKPGSYSHSSYYDNQTYLDYPVIYVNWQQAETYCEWVGSRLPSEAEWEKAARGVDSNAYPWGNSLPDATFSNFNRSIGDTAKVGSFPTDMSFYGALDMAGNAKEWVADWYSENYYEQSPLKNPTGPKVGKNRVLRGGSWLVTWEYLRSAFRDEYNPLSTNIVIGFRCATSQ